MPHTPRDRRTLLPISPVARSGAGDAPAIPGHDWLRRKRLAGGPSAALKLASGCDRRCAFCAIPAFRGSFVTEAGRNAGYVLSSSPSKRDPAASCTQRTFSRVASNVQLRKPPVLAPMRGANPTICASRPARPSTRFPPPPMRMGGWGCWTGFGRPSISVIR